MAPRHREPRRQRREVRPGPHCGSRSKPATGFVGSPTTTAWASPGTILHGPEGHALSAPRSAGRLTFDAPDGVPIPNPASAEPDTDEKAFSGTSAAAPNAASIAALMLRANPDLTTGQVTALLQASAIDRGLTPGQQGAGPIRVDWAPALAIGAPDAGETVRQWLAGFRSA